MPRHIFQDSTFPDKNVTGKTQLMLMSESQELALGQSCDPQVIATFGDYKDDDLLAFVQTKSNEMGHICARHTASQQTKQTLGQLILIGGMNNKG